jgi:hypothetical protein
MSICHKTSMFMHCPSMGDFTAFRIELHVSCDQYIYYVPQFVRLLRGRRPAFPPYVNAARQRTGIIIEAESPVKGLLVRGLANPMACDNSLALCDRTHKLPYCLSAGTTSAASPGDACNEDGFIEGA